MIVLHRFPLSHYSEKGRALLDFKRLPYRIAEHQLGLPQLRLHALSGQRQVPVLQDGDDIVSDSTEIALYLERRYPDAPRLLPQNGVERNAMFDLEHKLDRVLGTFAPIVWFETLVANRDELARLLAVEIHGAGSGRLLAAAVQRAWPLRRVQATADKARAATRKILLELCERLEKRPYLMGDTPTLADLAAATLAFHLQFPPSRHLFEPNLAGAGVRGFVDDPELRRFFDWRNAFYADYLA
jgi:glutathione S-transferase